MLLILISAIGCLMVLLVIWWVCYLGFRLAAKVLVCFGGLVAISSYVRYYVAFVFGASLVPLDSLCYVGCRDC